MNTETEKQAITTITVPDTTSAINKYLAEADPQSTIGKLIKFSKGEFLKGQDLELVPEGTMFTVACDMTLRGYIRWADNKPAEHRLVRIASGAPMPRREDLGYHDKSQWEKDAKDTPRDPWGLRLCGKLQTHRK